MFDPFANDVARMIDKASPPRGTPPAFASDIATAMALESARALRAIREEESRPAMELSFRNEVRHMVD